MDSSEKMSQSNSLVLKSGVYRMDMACARTASEGSIEAS